MFIEKLYRNIDIAFDLVPGGIFKIKFDSNSFNDQRNVLFELAFEKPLPEELLNYFEYSEDISDFTFIPDANRMLIFFNLFKNG